MFFNKRLISKVADEIKEKWHPERIILFGSYAYGRPTQDSDVDYLVVLDSKKRNLRQSFEISCSISHPFPMDILVVKPKEIEKRIKGGDLVLQEIINKGKILYEAGYQGMA